MSWNNKGAYYSFFCVDTVACPLLTNKVKTAVKQDALKDFPGDWRYAGQSGVSLKEGKGIEISSRLLSSGSGRSLPNPHSIST